MTLLTSVGRGIQKSVSGTTGFFRGSFEELKKVRWPTRKEMVNYTLVVLVVVIMLSIFLFLVDLGIGELVKRITK